MRGLFAGIGIWLALVGTATAAERDTAFDKVMKAFDAASLPEAADIQGYWSGRCLSSAEPSTLRPGLFVLKTVKNEEEFPPNRLSFTYYWTDTLKAEAFDTWTPAKVESDPQLKDWFAREQWERITSDGSSLLNHWASSPTVRYRREVRLYEDEFNRILVLRATRLSQQASDVTAVCHFSTKLGTGTGGGGEEESLIDIRFQNLANVTVKYNFRYSEDYEWSKKSLPVNTVHIWQKEVENAEPTVTFDSSFAIGVQERTYRLKPRQAYYFLRTTTGVDLYELAIGGPIPLWQGGLGWLTGNADWTR